MVTEPASAIRSSISQERQYTLNESLHVVILRMKSTRFKLMMKSNNQKPLITSSRASQLMIGFPSSSFYWNSFGKLRATGVTIILKRTMIAIKLSQAWMVIEELSNWYQARPTVFNSSSPSTSES